SRGARSAVSRRRARRSGCSMVTFDAAEKGTSVDRWDAEPRMRDRPQLSLKGVDELLVIAAHPDDETLGAAGLISECASRGSPAALVIVTDGGASETDGIVERRAAEAEAAARVLGARITQLGFADGRTAEQREEIGAALQTIISASSGRAL